MNQTLQSESFKSDWTKITSSGPLTLRRISVDPNFGRRVPQATGKISTRNAWLETEVVQRAKDTLTHFASSPRRETDPLSTTRWQGDSIAVNEVQREESICFPHTPRKISIAQKMPLSFREERRRLSFV